MFARASDRAGESGASSLMSERRRPWVPGAAGVAAFLLSAIPVVIFIRLVAARLPYPFDLEWIEGHMLAMATRVARGLSLYPEPSLEYLPAPYFPLYFFLTGWLVKLFGTEFWIGRLVSVLSTAGCGVLIFRAVWKRTRNALIAWACAAVFIASFGFTKAFYDLFRVDALAIFLLVLAFSVVDREKGLRRAALVALVLFAAVAAKQNALLFFPALAFVLFFDHWKKGLVFTAVFVLLTCGFCLLYNLHSQGWFLKYTFQLVGGSPIRKRYFLYHVWVASHLPVPMAIIGLACAARLARRNFRAFFGDEWLAFFVTSYLVSYVFRLTPGGAGNALIPVCAAGAIGAGTLLPAALSLFRKGGGEPDRVETSSPAASWALVVLILVQTLSQGHWYNRELPNKKDYQNARAFLNFLDGLEGRYYMPGHVLPRDNTFWIHEMSWRDFGASPWGRPIIRDLAARMRRMDVDYLIKEDARGFPRALHGMLKADYRLYKRLPNTIPLRMMSATRSAPGTVYRRK